jgi:hypothetical protein
VKRKRKKEIHTFTHLARWGVARWRGEHIFNRDTNSVTRHLNPRWFPQWIWAPVTQITTHPTSPQIHLGFCYLHCCTAKATSYQSSTCTYVCVSEPPSSKIILHRKMANKVFIKCSTRLLDRFIKFVIMPHLPLRHLQCIIAQLERVFSTQPSSKKRNHRTFSSLYLCLSYWVWWSA